jgi:hypothetical protein
MIVLVDRDGQVTVIAHDSDMPVLERAFGSIETTSRGGHVLPAAPVKQWAFLLLRKMASKRLAAWTRRWRGQWVADLTISNGPVLGPFSNRLEAVTAEETWLADKLTGR